jgi:BirA family transcriptional regulator, biotin operon repressor / biotin---[acetyl-CoA-carboxylase] ligase
MDNTGNITFLETVDSTNSYLRNSASPDNTIVYTFNQTAGKGRENRQWRDIKGKNLALSVVFNTEAVEVPLWRIALLSLPMLELLKSTGLSDSWIKWPNDLYVGKRKIAGILAESVIRNNNIICIIAGIGVNVNSDNAELSTIEKPATSVFLETGTMQDINLFSKRYIELLTELISEPYSADAIRNKWLSASGIIGKNFEWISPDGPVIGCAVDVDKNGILYLETNHGMAEIIAGDVNVRDCQILNR